MSVLTSSPSPPLQACLKIFEHNHPAAANFPISIPRHPPLRSLSRCSQLSNHQIEAIPITRVDKSSLSVAEGRYEAELWAAACLRVRTFYDFNQQTFGIEVSFLHNSLLVHASSSKSTGTILMNYCSFVTINIRFVQLC